MGPREPRQLDEQRIRHTLRSRAERRPEIAHGLDGERVDAERAVRARREEHRVVVLLRVDLGAAHRGDGPVGHVRLEVLLDQPSIHEGLRGGVVRLLGERARAIEAPALVGAGAQPGRHRDAIGIEVLRLEDGVELSGRARALEVVGAAQRAHDRRGEQRIAAALARHRAEKRCRQLVRLHGAPADGLAGLERQIARGLDTQRAVLRVGEAHADASRVLERAGADLGVEEVRAGAGIDMCGDAIEARAAVHVVALADVDAVEHETRLPGGREAHDDGSRGRQLDLRGDERAALLARMHEHVERNAARLRERRRHAAPRDLDRAPRVERLGIAERGRALRLLGTVVRVETAAGVAERPQHRDVGHDPDAARLLDAGDRSFVGCEGTRERERLAPDLRAHRRGAGDLRERALGSVVGRVIAERGDDGQRRDDVGLGRLRRERATLLGFDERVRRLGGEATRSLGGASAAGRRGARARARAGGCRSRRLRSGDGRSRGRSCVASCRAGSEEAEPQRSAERQQEEEAPSPTACISPEPPRRSRAHRAGTVLGFPGT